MVLELAKYGISFRRSKQYLGKVKPDHETYLDREVWLVLIPVTDANNLLECPQTGERYIFPDDMVNGELWEIKESEAVECDIPSEADTAGIDDMTRRGF